MTRPHSIRIVFSLWTLLASACSDQVVQINVNVTVTGPGTIVSDPPGLSCTSSCTASFPAGTLVSLKAQPMSGAAVKSFAGPAACVAGSAECFFALYSDVSASAEFAASPEACADGIKNGTETDVDCGGSCGACPIDSACAQSSDCKNAQCVMGLCTACPLDKNLLVNGDAETNAPGAVASGWRFTNGFSVQSYDSGNLASTDPGPADRGKNYFSGGLNAQSVGSTTLDLSACSKLASVQTIKFKASGWLGGFADQNDNFTVQFYARGAGSWPPICARSGQRGGARQHDQANPARLHRYASSRHLLYRCPARVDQGQRLLQRRLCRQSLGHGVAELKRPLTKPSLPCNSFVCAGTPVMQRLPQE